VASDTVAWDLTDTTITLRWSTVGDLNGLMARVLGNMPDGLAVPPGYPDELNDEYIYATVLAHKGQTQHFYAEKGKARTRSLNPGKGNSKAYSTEVSPAEDPWSTEDKPKRLKMSFTRHRVHDDPPAMSVTEHGVLSKVQGMGFVYHPMLAKWNDKGQAVLPEQGFVLAFACLAHVFTASSDKPFGIGIDALGFAEADEIHDRWIVAPVEAAQNDETALWGIATALDLSPGTYVTVGNGGSTFRVITAHDVHALYPILRAGMGAKAGVSRITRLNNIPIVGNGNAYAQIIRNIHGGRRWYIGVIPCVHKDKENKGKNKFDVDVHDQQTLTNILITECNAMEQQILDSMRKIRGALAAQYNRRYGRDGYARADEFIVNIHLNRARNRPALLKSLAAITREAGREFNNCGFNEEEMGWMLDRARCSGEVQSLLILACKGYRPKKEVQPDPDRGTTDVPDPSSL
jgi:hypothetical protein